MKRGHVPDGIVNLLGAFSLALSDLVRVATEDAAGAASAAPAALVQIGTYPGQTIAMLQLSLGLSQPATTRVVENLKERGLAVRGRGHDGREAALSLTPAGYEAMQNVLRRRRETLEKVLNRLDRQEREELDRILRRVLPELVQGRIAQNRACRLCDAGECPEDCWKDSATDGRTPKLR